MNDKELYDTAKRFNDEKDRLVALVNLFSEKMKRKLIEKLSEGYFGWNSPEFKEIIRHSLEEHVKRFLDGDETEYVDISNLCMFMEMTK